MTLVTVSGYPGSGTTTVVGLLAKSLGLPSYNIGDLFRMMAEEEGLTLAELHQRAREDRSIDKRLDEKQVEVARGGDVILEGRLAGFMTRRAGLPGIRAWLQAPFPVRVGRVAGREGIRLAQAEVEVRHREATERARYLDFYGFDLDDTSIYHLVIDSEALPAEAVAAAIEAKVKEQRRDSHE